MWNGKKKNAILLITVILISAGIAFILRNYVICRMLQAIFGLYWQIM